MMIDRWCGGVYLNILFARSVKFCKLDIDHQPWYWIIKKSHIQWVHPPFHPLWYKVRFIRKIVPQSSHLWLLQSRRSNLACLWLSCKVFTTFFDNVNSYYREFAKARVSNLMPHETKNQYHQLLLLQKQGLCKFMRLITLFLGQLPSYDFYQVIPRCLLSWTLPSGHES